MSSDPIIDERILDDIPEALIRPLLVLSILETYPNSIERIDRILTEFNALLEPYRSKLEGEALHYIMIYHRLQRTRALLQDAQAWGQQIDPAAKVGSVWSNRWAVSVNANGQSHLLDIEYTAVDLDPETMEATPITVITEVERFP